jgi:hypothetical protein
MKVSGVYADYYEMIKKTLFNQFGNPANCLQAKGFLSEVENAILIAENEIYGDIMQARLDALYTVKDYLQTWITNNCNEDGSTSVDTPPVTQYPGTGGQLPIDETPEPTPTEGGNSSIIWIAGAALIGFIIYTNNKKGYRRRSKTKRRK